MGRQLVPASTTDNYLAMLNILNNLKESFLLRDHSMVEPTPQTVEKFLALPTDGQVEILDMISKYSQLIAEVPSGGSLSAKDVERLRLQRAAADVKMKILDENIFNLINDGDVVEIYDRKGRQIYRNLTFCKLSSYNLLDVAVNTWQDLYERPSNTIDTIMSRVMEVMTTPALTIPYGMEKHIVRERLVFAKKQKVFLMDMKYLSPLADLATGQRVGTISVCRVQVLAENSGDIDFI